ncbi:TspO/MBR family protein [Foetidibacter luteolus]|uniref:TspO/MBR family protein n=1 Tax=Foetidibacter luteolus TaxID=2608880 RepID=UPI00129B295C|nr:TspO/MBR family protein [Foetidibacter luteolus]
MKLVLSLLITLSVGFVAGIATAANVDEWYAGLNKPAFNPPNSLFMPVWTVLYVLMGISLYLVWKKPPTPARNNALIIFFVQLALNFSWSFIFFSLHQPGWALVDIVALLLGIAVTINVFRHLSKTAAWLLVPYFLWVAFATVLNTAIYQLN